jgi:hypothetical protein
MEENNTVGKNARKQSQSVSQGDAGLAFDVVKFVFLGIYLGVKKIAQRTARKRAEREGLEGSQEND